MLSSRKNLTVDEALAVKLQHEELFAMATEFFEGPAKPEAPPQTEYTQLHQQVDMNVPGARGALNAQIQHEALQVAMLMHGLCQVGRNFFRCLRRPGCSVHASYPALALRHTYEGRFPGTSGPEIAHA